jgi:hypothetical protein
MTSESYRWILCWQNLYDGGSVIGMNAFVLARAGYKGFEKREKFGQVNHTVGIFVGES